jgi:hypothetical protein
MAPEAVHHFDTRTLHDLEQHLQQLGALLGKTAEAACLTAHMASRRDAAQARQRARAVRPTVLFEYCVCIQYDADPDRRVTDPAQTILVGGHLAPELIQLSGGAPLFTRPGDAARWVTFGEIRAGLSRLPGGQEAAAPRPPGLVGAHRRAPRRRVLPQRKPQ